MFKKRTSEWTGDSLFSIFSLNHVAVSNKNRRKSSGEAWWTRACWKPQKEKKKMLANKMQAGRCILIRYPYLQPRDVYAEICTRRKAYETRGISCCAPFVLCREWFPCESPIPPPCAPRPGYRALFIRYERYEILVYTEYSKHGNARRSCNYGSLFFFFRDSRTTHTHTHIYIRNETCYNTLLRFTLGHPEMEQGWKILRFTAADQKKGTSESVGNDGSRTEPDGAGYRAIHLVQTTPAKPTVSNYLTHSKTSRKSPTPPSLRSNLHRTRT